MMRKGCNGFWILLAVELLIVLFLFAAGFGEEEVICSIDRSTMQGGVIRTEEYVEYDSNRMTLTPGVYRIRVQSALADGQSIYVEMKCDTSYFNALRGNGLTIQAGSDTMEFDVYVLDTVSSAYVQNVFYGTDTESLVQLAVYKTDLGSRILAFILILVFAAIDFMVCFRRRILEGKVTEKQQVVFWTMVSCVLLAYLPYLTDYFFFGKDTISYLQRIVAIKDSLVQGTWLQGRGLTDFPALGELYLLIPALFQLTGFSIMNAYKLFVLFMMVMTALVTYHFLKKCVKEEYAALTGSMLYLLMPYHIKGIYSRGDVGEYMAMCFLPVICCGIYLLIMEETASKDYGKYKWYSIVGLAALLLCEPVSAGAAAVVLVSLLAAVLLQQLTEKCGNRAWAAVGAAVIMGLLYVVRMVNRIVYEATPVYLYDIKNLGTAGAVSMETIGYQEPVIIFPVGVAVILGINLYRKKRRQDGNQNRSEK